MLQNSFVARSIFDGGDYILGAGVRPTARSLRRAVLRSTRQAEDLPDLAEPQIEVLRLLQSGAMAPTQLATALHMASSTLSNLLKGMTDAGLIERARHPDDQRRVSVAISGHARSLLITYDHTSLSKIERFLARLSDEERAAFDATVPVLRRMCATFAAEERTAITTA